MCGNAQSPGLHHIGLVPRARMGGRAMSGVDIDRAYKIICELLRQAGGSATVPKSAFAVGESERVMVMDAGGGLYMRVVSGEAPADE